MVIFRCDAGPQIGFGHLIRCQTLALALNRCGIKCIIVGPDQSYQTQHSLQVFSEWIPSNQKNTAAEDANKLVQVASDRGIEMVILDHPIVNEEYQLILQQKGLFWLQFSRPNQKLWANFVLNSSPEAHPEEYRPFLQKPETSLLLGPKYAVIRPEFVSEEIAFSNKKIKQVLIMFGGGDDRGAIKFVLKTLMIHSPHDVIFLIIAGKHNPRNQELANWINECCQDRVTLMINPKNLASLFLECDLAIISGGTTTYEVASCGLPMIIISVAENQERQSDAWERMGAARHLGKLESIDSYNLANTFYKFMNEDNLRLKIAKTAKNLVDGKGALRVVNKIKHYCHTV